MYLGSSATITANSATTSSYLTREPPALSPHDRAVSPYLGDRRGQDEQPGQPQQDASEQITPGEPADREAAQGEPDRGDQDRHLPRAHATPRRALCFAVAMASPQGVPLSCCC